MNASDIEIVMRTLAALVASGVALVIVAGLARRRLRPRPLWAYAGVVVGVAAAWRWFLVWLGLHAVDVEYVHLLMWVQPVNAAILAVVTFALGLLALAAHRGIR